MSTRFPTFPVYHAALLDYVLASGESGLSHAYDLGRNGFDEGCGLLHILKVHEKALNTILESMPVGDEVRRRVNASTHFLVEALSPFDMACRGYRVLLKTTRPP